MLRKRILSNLIFILTTNIILASLSIAAEAQQTLANNQNTSTSEIKQVSARSHKHLDDLWVRIRRGFTLADMRSQEVRHNENHFTRHQKDIDHIVEQSRRYLFHIVEEVERRGMPTEIALIPIVESAFNPLAYSSHHASGLWQLIPSTGKAFGLEQNWWHDERRDVVAATRAALDYLQKLYKMFGDWRLTLAAYNCGEGALKRSIDENHKGNGRVNFRKLELPSQTKDQVAKIIAVRNIIANPENFGVELKPLPNRPYFEQVEINEHIDVKLAAELADVPENEFTALNPAHRRPIIRIDDSPRALLLPVNKVKTFVTNLENYDKSLVSWRVYRIKKAKTVEDLSRKYGVTVTELAEINGIAENGTVRKGQILLVPRDKKKSRGDDYLAQNSENDKRNASSLLDNQITYVVRKGDTLYDIARRYGIGIKEIKSWNGNTERLSIGQELTLRLINLNKIYLTENSYE
ncbi:transglycosylase SLT domain-containing protein [Nitrosomonas sp. Nm33]|uniref:transglycosylase SLT domain-containing protein n=1 Tax=Nitrosomonas sp. Nm33 TaxID=133724 RepID=UPI0008978382|nr:transglycosylase SLT domain-containing protein [Nitrosomonas sp. Nm33]SDY56763.1 membrane-bound lytic murein transglycosylase D [Nitrosomonas sp. Nm33]